MNEIILDIAGTNQYNPKAAATIAARPNILKQLT